MLIETHLPDLPWGELPRLAAAAERAGCESLAFAELKRDPFLSISVAATSTERVRLVPSVAIAFPRSPMVTAMMSRNLHDLSGGRFTLGLGTQVKGHIERRFSMMWDAPGPRLRDYVQSLRAIWASWQDGTPLDHQGRFYAFTLMTPEFDPGPTSFGPIGVHIAGVNQYNLRLAGELCEGLRVHPLTSPEYLRDVIWPYVQEGARKSGRSLDDFEMVGGGFIATGPDEEAVHLAREQARYRIAFYASTRTYLPVLEHHGWQDLNEKLRALIAQNRWEDLAGVIPDEVVDGFVVSGTWDVIAREYSARMGGLVDSVIVPAPSSDSDATARPGDRYLAMLEAMRKVPTARDRRSHEGRT